MKKMNLVSIALLSALSTGVQAAELTDEHNALSSKLPFGTSVSQVISAADGSIVNGASTRLERTFDKICISTTTKDLPAGAYTNWWMIFNNPEFCENPRGGGQCSGGPDVANPDVDTTVMWAAGGLVAHDGTGHFSSCTGIGELSHYIVAGGNGLVDPQKAEIQLVVRYHGPIDVTDYETIGKQVTLFPGGCADPANGVEGFACANLQFSAHSADNSKFGKNKNK